MRNWLVLLMFALGLSTLPMTASAQEETEETMEPIDGAEEGAEENMLTLPEEAAEEGHINSAFGLETANQARQQGAEFGRQRAEEAQVGSRPDVGGERPGQ